MKQCRKLRCRCSAADDSDVAAFEAVEIDMIRAMRQQILRKRRQFRGNMLEMAEAGGDYHFICR